MKDFAPAALIGTIPQVIIVSPKLKAATLREFIDHARASPGRVNIGNSGVGTTLAHPGGADGADDRHRGSSTCTIAAPPVRVADVMGGQIEAALSGFVPTYVTMKVLWRHLDRPDQGAAGRADVPRERARYRVGALAHAGGARRHAARRWIARLNAATNDFLKSERGKTFETNYSLQIAGGTPEAAREFLANDAARLEPVIRKARIAAD